MKVSSLTAQRWKARLTSPRTYSQAVVQLCKYLLLIGIAFIIVFPFFAKFSSSLMSNADLLDKTVKYVPKTPTLSNYKYVLTQTDYFSSLFNTLWISTVTAIIQTMICTCVAYGFARFKFRGRGIVFALVMFTMIIPQQTTIVSYFMTFRYFDPLKIFTLILGEPLSLVGSPIPVFILSICGTGLKSALYIYVLRQHFAGLPIELNEAASVDGAGIFYTFLTIMIPLARPMMVTVFLLSFSWQWTDTYYATMFFNGYNILPNILYAVTNFSDTGAFAASQQTSVYVNCAALLIVFPLVILYICTSKFMIGGIERSGLVG